MPSKTINNETAILGPTKIARKSKDGTTIVFYSFPDERELTNTKGLRQNEEGGAYTSITSANDAVKNDYRDAFYQIEGIANIKFFDIKNLTSKEKANLAANGITIPPTPDIIAYRVEAPLEQLGDGDFPRKHDTDPSQKDRINSGITNDPEDAANLKRIVLHEVMHNLGFVHTNSILRGKPVLDKDHDNESNTVMSHNKYDSYGTPYLPLTYRRLDILALQKTYGTSRNPTPGLMERIDQEENQQAASATTDIPVYSKYQEFRANLVHKLQELDEKSSSYLEQITKDNHPLDRKDIIELLQESKKLKEAFTPQELSFLQKNNPELGNIVFIPVSPQKNGENIEVKIFFPAESDLTMPRTISLTPEAIRELSENGGVSDGNYHLDLLSTKASSSSISSQQSVSSNIRKQLTMFHQSSEEISSSSLVSPVHAIDGNIPSKNQQLS